MNIETDQALNFLREQLAPLDERAAAAEKELTEIKEARKRYRAAIKALTAGGEVDATGKPANKRPCCKKSQAITITETILRENGSLDTETLRSLAMSKIAETMSKSGAALRLTEALNDDRFLVSPENLVSLRGKVSDLNIAPTPERALASIL